MIAGYPVHPVAELLPLLRGPEFDELVDDIRGQGQQEPALLWRGQIVDGRNRGRACEQLGIDLQVTDLPDDHDDAQLRELVISYNIRRRHLSVGQRAMLALELLPAAQERATERQRSAGAAGGAASPYDAYTTARNAETPNLDDKGSANLRYPSDATKASREVADAAGVSARSVETAARLAETAAPELVDQVRAGTLSLNAAHDVSRHVPEPDEQARLVREASGDDLRQHADPKAIREAARALADERKAEARARKETERARRAEEAAAAAPDLDGIELRHGLVEDLVADTTLTGAALVHVDAPWDYTNTGRGAAGHHYETSDQMADFIAAMNAAYNQAAEHAVCLAWVTLPHRLAWLRACDQHGLLWKEHTPAAWIKGRIEGGELRLDTGMGTLARGAVEDLFVYVKGAPRPFRDAVVHNVWVSPRTGHSEKPVGWLTELVDALTPKGGLVLDLYAGLAPMARACHSTGRRYVGAELDADRHRQALQLLAIHAAETPSTEEAA